MSSPVSLIVHVCVCVVQQSGRKPYHSINFVTAHDGFTLHDLVSYNEKHNIANGENNNDGENHNLSWNCGAVSTGRQAGSAAQCSAIQCNALAQLQHGTAQLCTVLRNAAQYRHSTAQCSVHGIWKG